MKDISNELLNDFVNACREAAARGLMRCSSGNMSLRVSDNRMLVTATRSWMSRLTIEDVALCKIEDGSVISGRKPTVEVNLHAGILRTRPEINVAMHFQTPHATTLACSRPSDINFFVIPEIPFYIGAVGRIPYFLPGTKELAEAVTEAMHEHDMVIMGNHGQVTVARDFNHAIQNAEFFELACEIIVKAGDAIAPLSPQQVSELFDLRQKASNTSV